jgi:hypothetical protein
LVRCVFCNVDWPAVHDDPIWEFVPCLGCEENQRIYDIQHAEYAAIAAWEEEEEEKRRRVMKAIRIDHVTKWRHAQQELIFVALKEEQRQTKKVHQRANANNTGQPALNNIRRRSRSIAQQQTACKRQRDESNRLQAHLSLKRQKQAEYVYLKAKKVLQEAYAQKTCPTPETFIERRCLFRFVSSPMTTRCTQDGCIRVRRG